MGDKISKYMPAKEMWKEIVKLKGYLAAFEKGSERKLLCTI